MGQESADLLDRIRATTQLALEVRKGQTRSYVQAAQQLADFVLDVAPLRSVIEAACALPRECDACAAKPGAPTLCSMCLAVRELRAAIGRS